MINFLNLFKITLPAILIIIMPGIISGQEIKNQGDHPLYMLTYDHGGLILWGTDHFEERLDNAISWVDKYPGFKIGLDNEAYVYDYLSENQPELLKKLQRYLDEYKGRFGIGSSTYGQPLSTFISGESNIRQIQFALEANQKYFGYKNKFYLMSEHAMHAQLPQILLGFGFEGAIMRTHYMMYGYNPTYNAPFGWWTGMDGSRIPAVPTYTGEGAEFGKTPLDNWILTRYPGKDATMSPEDFRKQFSQINPLLATRVDDFDLRKEELVQEYEGNPSFEWILVDDIPSVYPDPKVDFKTLPDDFHVRMPWGYCGNTIWNRCRQAENSVLTTEILAAMDYLMQGKNYEYRLKNAWKHLLVAQHHDIQIVGLLTDARNHLDLTMSATRAVQEEALKDVSKKMKGWGVKQVTVFNPLSWPANQWIETSVKFDRDEARDIKVICGEETMPSALLDVNRYSNGFIMDCKIAFLAKFNDMGIKNYSIVPDRNKVMLLNSGLSVKPEKLEIRTPWYVMTLNPSGGIKSLIVRKTGRQVFRTDRRNGILAGLIEGKEEESHGRWIISKANPDSPWINATEYGFIGDIPYTIHMILDAASPRINCRVTVELDSQRIGILSHNTRESVSPFVHEKKLRFKFFPSLNNPAGVRDLPFVVSATSDRYIQGNYWTAVEDAVNGVAVFNKGTMCLVREKDNGVSIPLAYAMYYIWGTRMLKGEYTYEFALLPYKGKWRDNQIHRKAIAYNFPFLSIENDPQQGRFGEKVDLLKIQSDHVILSALYIENSRVVARMYEDSGVKAGINVENRFNDLGLIETDLLGNELKSIDGTMSFDPWEIKTLQFYR